MDRKTKRRMSYPTILGVLVVMWSVVFVFLGWWMPSALSLIAGLYIAGLKDLWSYLLEGFAEALWSPDEEESI